MSWLNFFKNSSFYGLIGSCCMTLFGNIYIWTQARNDRPGDGTIYPILCVAFTCLMMYPIQFFYYAYYCLKYRNN